MPKWKVSAFDGQPWVVRSPEDVDWTATATIERLGELPQQTRAAE